MIDEQSEKEFNEWMESITFVDEDDNVLPVELTDDITDDPEGDRE
jgi:hypothetical protein